MLRVLVSSRPMYQNLETRYVISLCSFIKGAKKVTKCGDCNGMGMRIRQQRMGPMITQSQQPCSKCSATGEIVDPKTKCKVCSGKKTCRSKKILEVSNIRQTREKFGLQEIKCKGDPIGKKIM